MLKIPRVWILIPFVIPRLSTQHHQQIKVLSQRIKYVHFHWWSSNFSSSATSKLTCLDSKWNVWTHVVWIVMKVVTDIAVSFSAAYMAITVMVTFTFPLCLNKEKLHPEMKLQSLSASGKSKEGSQSSKHFWSFTAKQCCSILPNSWSSQDLLSSKSPVDSHIDLKRCYLHALCEVEYARRWGAH